jgi:hypothetical protein
VVLHATLAIAAAGGRLLVCAPSNAAADVLVKRLAAKGVGQVC